MTTNQFKHCDDYIHDPKYPICLRVWLLMERMTPEDKYLLNQAGLKAPSVFATYKGERVRLTKSSSYKGLVSITNLFCWSDGSFSEGSEKLVPLSDLTEFSTDQYITPF